jgi:hypothetical protein
MWYDENGVKWFGPVFELIPFEVSVVPMGNDDWGSPTESMQARVEVSLN